MSRVTDAKEALLVELIGDATKVAERCERLVPAIDKARVAMQDAAFGLTAGVAPFKEHMVKIAGLTQVSSIEQIERKAREMQIDTLFDQKLAMTQAARAIFKDEVGPTLSQLTKDLREAIDRAHHPWDAWKTHAATAAVTAWLSWLIFYFAGK